MEELLKEILEGKQILDKEQNGYNSKLIKGKGSKAYIVKRIDLLRKKLLELKKTLK